MRKKEKIVLASVVAFIVVAIVAVVLLLMRNNYLATTMRLLRVEGTVNIEDSTGTTKPVIDNIRFESGDALSTGSDGLASVGLDDTKIVTLENDSRVEFSKQGKQLELNLTQGGIFFEVTEKLADDEKYEIKTSNMTVGIRGTSGYVYYSESGLQSLIITDGVVKVTGYNPKTNETKEVEVRAGEKVTTYLYDESTDDRDSIEFEVVEIPVEEIPEFPLMMLAENSALLDKVCADTGWNKDELLALVYALLDPEAPTPTPDEIIEITETPEPTEKPTKAPTLTPTPTETISPSTTASPTPTKKPTTSPTPAATQAAGAASNPTSTPASTPSGSTTSTPTTMPKTSPTPSASTPSPTPKATPTAVSTPSTTPEPTPDTEPALPKGFSKFNVLPWGIENDDGDIVYICRSNSVSLEEDDIGEYIYYGYIDGDWELLDLVYSDNLTDVNDDGQIYAYGTVSFEPDEENYAYYTGVFEQGELFLSAPIPEPGETEPQG